ncbi:MAG: sigma-70 family RNA polymerase sigma factor [Candidatus Levybacteria bacterium]|nr:sigma-70 family RNA polymerase sigma factor [Candidatus Levybacteria bacterium]
MKFQRDFDAIYLEYSDRIYRYLYIHTRNPYLSEDITSEVFLRLWKKWESIRFDFIQALLFKIARNILIDYWRKKKEKKEFSLEEVIETGLEPRYNEDFIENIQKDENIRHINGAIAYLPKNLKDVVILRFIEDLSAKETALILKISEVNVRVLQYRALKKLKKFFKK